MSSDCVMGDGPIGTEPYFEDDGDYVHQRCALASLERSMNPAGRWERCTPDLLRRHPSICSEQGIDTGMRRIVGLRPDGTCEGHDHWVTETEPDYAGSESDEDEQHD